MPESSFSSWLAKASENKRNFDFDRVKGWGRLGETWETMIGLVANRHKKAKEMAPKFETFDAFFPYYLAEHANPTCRRLHYIGTILATSVCIGALVSKIWWLLILYPIIGYGFAWIGHFKFERNRPATFDYPRWSLMGDYKMLYLFLTGRLNPVLRDAIIKYGKVAH